MLKKILFVLLLSGLFVQNGVQAKMSSIAQARCALVGFDGAGSVGAQVTQEDHSKVSGGLKIFSSACDAIQKAYDPMMNENGRVACFVADGLRTASYVSLFADKEQESSQVTSTEDPDHSKEDDSLFSKKSLISSALSLVALGANWYAIAKGNAIKRDYVDDEKEAKRQWGLARIVATLARTGSDFSDKNSSNITKTCSALAASVDSYATLYSVDPEMFKEKRVERKSAQQVQEQKEICSICHEEFESMNAQDIIILPCHATHKLCKTCFKKNAMPCPESAETQHPEGLNYVPGTMTVDLNNRYQNATFHSESGWTWKQFDGHWYFKDPISGESYWRFDQNDSIVLNAIADDTNVGHHMGWIYLKLDAQCPLCRAEIPKDFLREHGAL